MATQDIGIVGLGVMGQNLGFNILRNGFSIAGYSRTPEKVQKFPTPPGCKSPPAPNCYSTIFIFFSPAN